MLATDKVYEGVNYLQKTLDLPLNTEIIKKVQKSMMDGKKDALAGEYRKSQAFAGYHIQGYMEDAVFRFHETKKTI